MERSAKKEQKKNYARIADMSVTRAKQLKDGTVFFDCTVNDVKIYGAKVVDGKNGQFVSWPSKKGTDGEYYSVAYVYISPDDQETLLDLVDKCLEDQKDGGRR